MLVNKPKLLINRVRKSRNICQRCYCNLFPSSEVKIIRHKPVKSEDNLNKNHNEESIKNPESKSKEFRVNPLNIQMISKNLYDQLFTSPSPVEDPEIIKSCQEHLLKHGIDYRKGTHLPDVELKLPKLEGKDVVEHFYNIGEQQAAPYRKLLLELTEKTLPSLPKKWSKSAGWTKYTAKGSEKVPCPPDDALVLDVEVLMSAGKRPTLACAVSSDAWYGWVSKPVANNSDHQSFDTVNYESLIPLETDGDDPCGDLTRPRIVVGHNVSYDRTKIKEQYWFEKTGVRFMDTMSMHTCVSGVTSYQRAALKAREKDPGNDAEDWMDISSLNSLKEVHKLYCGTAIDKQTRDVFVEGKMADVHGNFQNLMSYCANDVIATWNVLRKLLPLFLERFPHPVTFAGMLELGSAYLPVNSNWTQYIESAETVFEDCKLETRQLLSLKADEACRLMVNHQYEHDLWMWDQDWSVQRLKLKKQTVKFKKKMEAQPVNLNVELNPKNIELELPDLDKEFDVLNEEYIDNVASFKLKIEDDGEIDMLNGKFAYLYEMGQLLPVKRPFLPGYPAWYRKLCTKPSKDPDWTPGANNITTSMQITPKLLRLSWEGYPLHHLKEEKWGFLVPFTHHRPVTYEQQDGEPQIPLEQLLEKCPVVKSKDPDAEMSERTLERLHKKVEADVGRRTYYARKKLDETAAEHKYHGLGVWSGIQLQGCCHFLRLPHKDGPKYKVGNPLARDFLDMFSQNVLSAQGNDAEKVLNFSRMMSYWRNNRERITGQQVVWLPWQRLPEALRTEARRYGAILPQVVVCGTLTRRASEPTWMTASNAQKDRIGSELRAMVQAPKGYKFVGADVDSQELWIAALLGDSTLGVAGGTAFGWSVLAGSKASGTDLHSLTAAAAGLSRDHAKVINYGRIYGAGQNFAERLLKQFNPSMSNAEAKNKAAKMFSTTKGRRVYTLKAKYTEGFLDEDELDQVVEMTGYQAMRMAKMHGKAVQDIFHPPKWVGGTESEMFNKLEQIAASPSPRTSFLSGVLSRALCTPEWEAGPSPSSGASASHAATILNWAVQSAAADYLHLMTVAMNWATRARFCLSFHDEVRYLVPDEKRYEAAMALQITNLLTRTFCSQRVGMNDLPMSVAFFTSVEVDQVLRKESQQSCATPSNPHGLEKGYGIPNGESLDIFDVINKCDSKE